MNIKELLWNLFHPNTINIHSKWSYPSCALSNFAAYKFYVDNVECNSMESFLKSLKFEDPQQQREICLLTGIQANIKGNEKDWKSIQTLYWQGEKYGRESRENKVLLQVAYSSLLCDEVFCKALLSTSDKTLRYTVGGDNPKETILTEREFCDILTRFRNAQARLRTALNNTQKDINNAINTKAEHYPPITTTQEQILSIYTPYTFYIDNVKCNSMAGFLKSLEYCHKTDQKRMCSLSPKEVREKEIKSLQKKIFAGCGSDTDCEELKKYPSDLSDISSGTDRWWLEKPIEIHSYPYIELVKRAFLEMMWQNQAFRDTIIETEKMKIPLSLWMENDIFSELNESECATILEELRRKATRNIFLPIVELRDEILSKVRKKCVNNKIYSFSGLYAEREVNSSYPFYHFRKVAITVESCIDNKDVRLSAVLFDMNSPYYHSCELFAGSVIEVLRYLSTDASLYGIDNLCFKVHMKLLDIYDKHG